MDEAKLLDKLYQDYLFAKKVKGDKFKRTYVDGDKELVDTSTDLMRIWDMWYHGYHWKYKPDGTEISTEGQISKPTFNFIRTIIDQQQAMVMRRRFNFEVKPVQVEDYLVSGIATDILKFLWKQNFMQTQVALAFKDSRIYGTGFLKVRWDGKTVRIDVINPMNVYPDAYGYTIDELRFITILYEKTQEYIEYVYGEKVNAEEDGRVVLYETWYNPSKQFPEGLYVAWTQDKILKKATMYEMSPAKVIPIVAIRRRASSDSFWGQTAIRDLAEVQLVHNKMLGVLIDNLLLTNNPQFQTIDDDIEKNNTPGYIYKVSQPNSITPIITPQISPQFFQLVMYSGYQQQQNLSGTYAVNAGGAAGTDTASGIIALQQAGGALSDYDFREMEETMSLLGKIILKFAIKFMKSDILQMIDVRERPEVANIDYKILANIDFDVFIDFRDALPEDKIARFNLLLQLVQGGVIDKAQFIEFLDDPVFKKFYEETQQQVQMQQMQMMQAMAQQMQGQSQAQNQQEAPAQQPEGTPPEENPMKERVNDLRERIGAMNEAV